MRIRSQRLPAGYQEVEYIQSTGTQRIKLNITPTSQYKIEEVFEITDKTVTSCIWCARGATTQTTSLTAFNIANSGLRVDFNTTQTNVQALNVNQKYNLTLDSNKWYLDGTLKVTSATTVFTAGGKLELFASYTNGQDNSLANYAKLKMYSFKVWNANRELVGNFVPCYRKSDTVIGLYDVAGNSFYSNNGTGTFLKGDDICLSFKPRTTLLPTEYQQVEYLAGVNGNQYINTAYIPSYTKGFNIEFGFNPTVSGRRYCLLSNYNTGNQQLSLELAADNKVRLWMNNGSNDKKMTQTFTVNAYNKINYIYKSGTWTMIMTNGSGTYTDTGSYSVTGASTTTMRMFVDNATRTSTFNTPLKIYYCKIYEENILIHYYVPCYRKSDTTIGIYDVVTKSFLINNGSGTFTKGDNNTASIKCQIPGFIYGYNQLFYPTTSGNWIGNAASATFSDGIITATSTSTANYWGIQHVSNKSAPFYKNHKYYFSAECYPDTVAGNGSNTGLNLYSTNSGYVYQQSKAIPEKTWTRIESIFTVGKDSSGTIYPWIFTNQRNDRTVGDKVSIKNAMLIDLTEWYGAGNEPTYTTIFSNTFPNSFYPTEQTTTNLLIDEINKL